MTCCRARPCAPPPSHQSSFLSLRFTFLREPRRSRQDATAAAAGTGALSWECSHAPEGRSRVLREMHTSPYLFLRPCLQEGQQKHSGAPRTKTLPALRVAAPGSGLRGLCPAHLTSLWAVRPAR